MRRRSWWAAGVAAAAAGLGWQLGRMRPALPTAPRAGDTAASGTVSAVASAASAAADSREADPAAALWQARFVQPDGTPLVMAAWRGTPLVVNFWGTWCPPCVQEMPELDRFARSFAAQGGRVVGLAVDNPKAVREFLAKRPVGYAIAMAGFDGTDLSRKLGNTGGALPFTAVLDRAGKLARVKLGTTDFDELASWVQRL